MIVRKKKYEIEPSRQISMARQFCEVYVQIEAREKGHHSAKRYSYWDKVVKKLLARYEATQSPMEQDGQIVGSCYTFPDGSHVMANFAYPEKLIVDR